MIAPILLLLLQAPVASGQPPVAVDRSAAIAREAALAADASPIDARARAELSAILAERAFSKGRVEPWSAPLVRRLRDWLADMWQRTLGRSVGRRTVATALAWASGVAAVIVLLVWLLRLNARTRRERPLSMGPMEAPQLPGHILGIRAKALIDEGNIREGARVAYHAGISRLAEEGALRVDEARTPRESLRLLPDRHRRRAAFARLTAVFEHVWYGPRAPAASTGEEIVRLLRDLECLSFDRAR